ncbi:MAG: efflux transporter outer membrane subunit [Thiomonas sp.]|uniref:efflux transporter outer membrane subunit n=1 Tax=Thiomonas sp. TaxID=2047785 RepID=UPI002A35FA96|nr:efflux transporter outer membrane subunit [Thiomonas sp.]MDY0331567.1 efflux transporter outer membrane subunit [Thiomonas sp.]
MLTPSLPRSAVPRRALLAVPLLAALLLAGCAGTEGIKPTGHLTAPQQLGLQPVQTAFPKTDWWTAFHDPELDRLIAAALADNPTLQVAQARLALARSQVESAGSVLKPKLDAAVSSTREQFSNNSIYGPYGGDWFYDNSALLQGSWELDFFGKNRQNLQAAIGEAHAAAAQDQAARVLLAANVANAYVNLARLIAMRHVLQQTLQQREHMLKLVRDRVRAGLETTVQEKQALAEVPQIRLQIDQTGVQITQARNLLAALIGQGPQATATLAPQLATLPTIDLPDTLPAALIGRRADIVAARWQVEAALHGVKAARAAFYPNVNLTAFAGFSALGFSQWLTGGSQTLGVGPALTLPIFEGGALRAQLRSKSAQADEAIAQYNNTLVGAVHEVADAIAARQSIGQQIAQQQQALAAAQDAMRLVDQRYKAGLSNYLTVLSVETSVLQLQQMGVDLKAQALSDDVALIRALGGGYKAEQLPERVLVKSP